MLLAVVLLAGTMLRLRGLDWGLPWALHIDERLFIAEKAIALEKSIGAGGLPDPGITSYGILPLWLVVLARRLFLGALAVPGPPAYGDSFAATIFLARAVSAAAGVGAIAATWAWARRWGAGVGVAAAACAAGFPALVQASHFGTVESLLVLGIAATMLAGERVAERPSRARALLAGLLWGAALSVKSPAVLLAFPLLHAARRRFALVAAAALAVVLALNPGLAAAPFARGADAPPAHTTVLGNLQRAYSSELHDWTLAYAQDRPILTELGRLLPHGAGYLAEGAALLGLGIAVRRRAPRDRRLLFLLVPLLLRLLPARVRTISFLLPAFTAIAVLAASGAAAAFEAIGARARDAALAAVAGVTLLHGAAFSAVYAGEDPRVAAALWLDANVGRRELVLVEDPPGYGPPIGSPTPEIRRAPLRYEILWRNFYVVHERRTDEERRAHLDGLLERAEWIALSEGHRAEYEAAAHLRPVERKFYEDLDAGRLPFTLAATFESKPRLGPFVIDDAGAEVLQRVFDHPRIEIWRRTRVPAVEEAR